MWKKISFYFIAVVAVLFGFLFWYDYTYSMEVLETREVHDVSLDKKVLIASQGSEYKNQLVQRVTENEVNDSIYFKIIDVSLLPEISPKDWDAIIILHVWEIWKPEPNAKKFLDQYYDESNMFVVCTSGSGDERIETTDGITGASKMDNLDQHATEIQDWLTELTFSR